MAVRDPSLAIALLRTAEALDGAYQTSTMSVYIKQVDQIEKLRPAAGQSVLPGTSPADLRLLGPRQVS
ncbi:hypothetical protein G7085_12860 [Tessaracoccus sp. HDW20]|nr:hypothetical protein [Tessaracoccus coleopterorum]